MNFSISARRYFFVVLRRDHDRIDADWRRAVELDRDLALAIGAKPIDFFLEAGFGQTVDDFVRQRDWQRHQLFGVVAGVAEHEALVAGADVFALGLVDSRPSRYRGFARAVPRGPSNDRH